MTITIVSPIASSPMIDAPARSCCRLVALTKFGLSIAVIPTTSTSASTIPSSRKRNISSARWCELARCSGSDGGICGRSSVTVMQPRSSTSPVAACMIASSSASARVNSRVTLPSKSTTIRSAMPSTSGSSDEIISTATPCAARSERRRCTSAFVPTSIPRVGSSTIRSDGFRASHFASTAFCWLPPESVHTGSVSRPYLSWSRSAQSRANLRSAPGRISPNRRTRRSDESAMLRSIAKSITSPCCRLSSGTRPIPAAIAAVGEAGGSFCPSIRTAPASQRSMPKIARATSVRPAPTSPASATISPLQTWNETSVKTPSRVSRSTSSTTRPRSLATFGKSASMSRPTIARITDCAVNSFVS